MDNYTLVCSGPWGAIYKDGIKLAQRDNPSMVEVFELLGVSIKTTETLYNDIWEFPVDIEDVKVFK